MTVIFFGALGLECFVLGSKSRSNAFWVLFYPFRSHQLRVTMRIVREGVPSRVFFCLRSHKTHWGIVCPIFSLVGVWLNGSLGRSLLVFARAFCPSLRRMDSRHLSCDFQLISLRTHPYTSNRPMARAFWAVTDRHHVSKPLGPPKGKSARTSLNRG